MRGSAAWTLARARTELLVVERLRDETLVYDLDLDQAHHLNPTAAAIFELADGRTSTDRLAALASRQLGQPVSVSTVHEALDQLAAKGLLEEASSGTAGISRREAVRKVALVAGAAAAAPAAKPT